MASEPAPDIRASIGLTYLSKVLRELVAAQFAVQRFPLRLNDLQVEQLESGVSLGGQRAGPIDLPATELAVSGTDSGAMGPGGAADARADVTVWSRARLLGELLTRAAAGPEIPVPIRDIRPGRMEAWAVATGEQAQVPNVNATTVPSAAVWLDASPKEQLLSSLAVLPRMEARLHVGETIPSTIAGVSRFEGSDPDIIVVAGNSFLNDASDALLTYFEPYLIPAINLELGRRLGSRVRLRKLAVWAESTVLKLEAALRLDLGFWQPDVTAVADITVGVHDGRVQVRVLNIGLGESAKIPGWLGAKQIHAAVRSAFDWLIERFVVGALSSRVQGRLPAPIDSYQYEITHYQSTDDCQIIFASLTAGQTG